MTNSKSIKTTAPGQYAGYTLQSVRLCYHLLTCSPTASVGLEIYDDISIHHKDGSLTLEQCKSASSGNPVSDWAEDLWKTFSNWLKLIEGGLVDPTKTNFDLYVTPAKGDRSKKTATTLSDLKSEAELSAFIVELRGKNKLRNDRKNHGSPPDFADEVLGKSNELLIQMFQKFRLINTDDDRIKPIRDHLDAALAATLLESAINFAVGKAEDVVNQKILSGQNSPILAEHFRLSFKAFLSHYDQSRMLNALVEKPSEGVVSEVLSGSPIFVRQMELIEAEVDEKIGATSDYLMAKQYRTHWADEGIVFHAGFEEYEGHLVQRHKSLRKEIELTQKTLSDVDRGKLLLSKCSNFDGVHLSGKEVPLPFMSGTLHNLSDQREIGWHPNFQTLLGRKTSK